MAAVLDARCTNSYRLVIRSQAPTSLSWWPHMASVPVDTWCLYCCCHSMYILLLSFDVYIAVVIRCLYYCCHLMFILLLSFDVCITVDFRCLYYCCHSIFVLLLSFDICIIVVIWCLYVVICCLWFLISFDVCHDYRYHLLPLFSSMRGRSYGAYYIYCCCCCCHCCCYYDDDNHNALGGCRI